MALNYLLNEIGTAYSVVSDSCTTGDVIIPNTYNGLPVEGVEESAFLNCNSITSVTIPSSIEYIGNQAFENCSNLSILNFSASNSQLGIGASAFKGCVALNNVTLPSNIVLYGSYIFQNCTGLTNINLPDNLTSIPIGCFLGCTNLLNINLPNSINSIGVQAFGESGLIEITWPESLQSLGSNIFNNCLNLKKIILHSKINYVQYDSFNNCPNLTKVYFKGSQPDIVSFGSPNFVVSNLNLKFYRKKNFVTGWGSTYGGIPVVLWSDNVIKGGGPYYYASDSYEFTNLNNLSVIGRLDNDVTEEEYSELQLTLSNILGRDQVYRIKDKNILFLPIILGIGFETVSYVYQWYVVYKNFNDPLDPFNGELLYNTDDTPSLTPLTEINLWLRNSPVFEVTSSLTVSLKGPGKLTTKERTPQYEILFIDSEIYITDPSLIVTYKNNTKIPININYNYFTSITNGPLTDIQIAFSTDLTNWATMCFNPGGVGTMENASYGGTLLPLTVDGLTYTARISPTSYNEAILLPIPRGQIPNVTTSRCYVKLARNTLWPSYASNLNQLVDVSPIYAIDFPPGSYLDTRFSPPAIYQYTNNPPPIFIGIVQ